MYSHAPPGYVCPFCLLLQGAENEHVYSRQSDIVYQDDRVTGFISSHQWPHNRGHVLLIPNAHFENVFDLPLPEATALHQATRIIACAMKRTYQCDGISTRQHNEPAGNQDVWHYHLHVFPRYPGDNLYTSVPALVPSDERKHYADALRRALRYGE